MTARADKQALQAERDATPWDAKYQPHPAPFIPPPSSTVSYESPVESALPRVAPVEPSEPVEPVPPVALAEPVVAEPDPTPTEPVAPVEPAQPVQPRPHHQRTASLLDADSAVRLGSRRRPWVAMATFLAGAVVGTLAGGGAVALSRNKAVIVDGGLSVRTSAAPPALTPDGSAQAAAAKILPSVVTVRVSGAAGSTSGAATSGVLIRSDGYILTSSHAVPATGLITVQLADGRSSSASLVGRDPSGDLAVLHAAGLGSTIPAQFGRSSALTVGQSVLAVGALSGLFPSVSSGIISATGRALHPSEGEPGALVPLLQTTVPVPAGSSGAPLVDLAGSVVGINTSLATVSSPGGLELPGGAANDSPAPALGFAIPSDDARTVAAQLILTGRVDHAVLGIRVGASRTSSPATLRVISVTPRSGARRAGLRIGDAIIRVGATPVSTPAGLATAVAERPAGTSIQLTYRRKDKTVTVLVPLESAQD